MVQRYSLVDGRIIPAEENHRITFYVAPDEEERRSIQSSYGIDAHDLGSALDPDELGRIDVSDEMTVFILKTPRNYSSEDQLLFTVTSIGLFLLPDQLVVVTTDPVELFDDRVVRKVLDARDVVLKILYGIIAHFLGHLRVINMLSDSLEKRVNASMGNRYLLDMFTLEKSLVYFING
ncbi:MAG TPA: CorA family divalent cation transporter, partial [Rectinemataceae bacterium]|nr:CorA family divalent cation transporter [Rectinemataceae bacterium]